jgi:hypothetical protein
MGSDEGDGVTKAVGPHCELLAIALTNADTAWPHHKMPQHPPGGTTDWPDDPGEVGSVASSVRAELETAARHVALLLLVQRSRDTRVGERVDVGAALSEWGLPAGDAREIIAWIAQDPPEFDSVRVPLVADSTSGSLYRTPIGSWEKAYTTTAALWGAILGLGSLIAVFALLRFAHTTTWPPDWFPKVVVLYLCVVGGALVHIASKSLASIQFDDPLRVYAASAGLDWLRLRWLSIVRLLVPITVVAGSLWGAGNYPTRFQALGVALLAGYSADSLFRNSISRLASKSS